MNTNQPMTKKYKTDDTVHKMPKCTNATNPIFGLTAFATKLSHAAPHQCTTNPTENPITERQIHQLLSRPMQAKHYSQEALTHAKLPAKAALPLWDFHPTVAILTPLPTPTSHSPSSYHTPRSSYAHASSGTFPPFVFPLQSQFLLFSLSALPFCSLGLQLRLTL